jgi:hypothetical protein
MQEKHNTIKVGDGMTICAYRDRHAGTVIKVTPKRIFIQLDKAELDKSWKPEIVPGGFSGHCINNDTQVYNYSPNPDGPVYQASLCIDGRIRTSVRTGRMLVINGRHQHYDYNF